MIDLRISYISLSLAALLSLGVSSCSSEDLSDEGRVDLSGALRVSARVARNVQTRAYQDTGRVVNGKYYLSYPNTDNQYTVATVDFDRESAESPGLGIVVTNSGTELKWSQIGGSPVNFYLDNVMPSLDQANSNGPTVTFNPDNNPFVAGLFDKINGSNDLLWGEKSVTRDTKSISFDLHHNMSRVKVQVMIAHKENSVGEINLNNAKVEITNLYAKTLSYDRTTGNLAPDTISPRESVKIVDTANPQYTWAQISTPQDNPDTTTYLSQDIVLPPQALLENEERPQLIITLDDGNVYTGILPHAMLIANATDGSLTYPVTLSFLKEYILTIRTVITEEPPELSFMPVYVVGWVDKGEFTEEAHQSGIYTASEFYKLIDYYKINNQYQLVRYGYTTVLEGNTKPTWLFNFWSSVTLDYDKIFNKMTPYSKDAAAGLPYDFNFSFNNYTIFVQNGEGEENIKSVSNTQLYNICTGRMNWSQIN